MLDLLKTTTTGSIIMKHKETCKNNNNNCTQMSSPTRVTSTIANCDQPTPSIFTCHNNNNNKRPRLNQKSLTIVRRSAQPVSCCCFTTNLLPDGERKRNLTSLLCISSMSLVLLALLLLAKVAPSSSSSSMSIELLHGAASNSEQPHEHELLQQSSLVDSFGSGRGASFTSSSQLQQQQNSLLSGVNFDPSHYKSIQEAIREHPDLTQFASLCQAPGVKEIISMDKMPLTVFAPIDRSMSDLMEKSSARQINLLELAKHHIAQGMIVPDENSKFPMQFRTFTMMSPLYLNQVTLPGPSSSSSSSLFVNNAKILTTHLIAIQDTNGETNYQTLHLIDQPLEFAYMKQSRAPMSSKLASMLGGGGSSSSGGGSSANSNHQAQNSQLKKTTVKRPFDLDELVGQPEAAMEFYERFGDIHSSQPDEVDCYHARAYSGTSSRWQSPPLITSDQVTSSLKKLVEFARTYAPSLKGKLYQVNESSSVSSSAYNTFFLPIEWEELIAKRNNPQEFADLLEAHIIPDQVLFTRQMGPLGHAHPTLLNSGAAAAAAGKVSLNLAKTMPTDASSEQQQLLFAQNDLLEQHQIQDTKSSHRNKLNLEEQRDLSVKYLTTPLLLQAQSSSSASDSSVAAAGITSSEILIANIPLTNGVLHLIRRPIGMTDLAVMDYVNDNEKELSNVVNAWGSTTQQQQQSQQQQKQSNSPTSSVTPAKVNRFRELLAREWQMLQTFSNEPSLNRTIFAPSDEAFSRLRFDLRALVQGDESLIPKHWDASYRQKLLERLVKRHVVLHQTLTIDQIVRLQQQQQQVLTDNGKALSFGGVGMADNTRRSSSSSGPSYIESDGIRARFLHHDLIGTNGVLHIIDHVLGEEQETVHSLLRSNVLKLNHSLHSDESINNKNRAEGSITYELNELIQTNLRALRANSQQPTSNTDSSSSSSETMISSSNSVIHQSSENSLDNSARHLQQQQQQSPELGTISKSIGIYLDELASSKRRQLDLLASSVNISYQLARQTSLAEGLEDWNERFKSARGQFTYFVPSDLAWIRLQQSQPELYRPLMYFLDTTNQQQEPFGSSSSSSLSPLADSLTSVHASSGGGDSDSSTAVVSAGNLMKPRSSESSHRLRQILERHLVSNRKISTRELNQLDSIQTSGATLRLMESTSTTAAASAHSRAWQQLEPMSGSAVESSSSGSSSSSNVFAAALHSIVGTSSPSTSSSNHNQQSMIRPLALKSLQLESSSANIVQAQEASNGWLYVIDSVLLLPNDAEHIVMTSASPAISSTMSSLLGAHNSAILDFIQSLFAPAPINMSASSIVTLIGTLMLAIALLLLVAVVLIARKRRQTKLNRHQQLESGLTSSSSANSGSTSTTKSL